VFEVDHVSDTLAFGYRRALGKFGARDGENEAILTHLEELEDYYLTERVMEKVRKGEERLFSLDDVERDLGLES